MDAVKREALRRAGEDGIIFIDEIDKVAGSPQRGGPDVSREGVQRDILPIVEGSTVNTKHGTIKTDHVLFIAAGAFHISKPSDLIPELQGRLPIRVELDSLTAEDFKTILTQPKNALVEQYKALLATDGVTLDFREDAIDQLATFAMTRQRTDREHRRAPPAHRVGARAGRRQLRRSRDDRHGRDRRRLRARDDSPTSWRTPTFRGIFSKRIPIRIRQGSEAGAKDVLRHEEVDRPTRHARGRRRACSPRATAAMRTTTFRREAEATAAGRPARTKSRCSIRSPAGRRRPPGLGTIYVSTKGQLPAGSQYNLFLSQSNGGFTTTSIFFGTSKSQIPTPHADPSYSNPVYYATSLPPSYIIGPAQSVSVLWNIANGCTPRFQVSSFTTSG